MDISAISAFSVDMSLAKVQQSAQMSVLKKAMEANEASMDQMMEALEAAVPLTDHVIDVLA